MRCVLDLYLESCTAYINAWYMVLCQSTIALHIRGYFTVKTTSKVKWTNMLEIGHMVVPLMRKNSSTSKALEGIHLYAKVKLISIFETLFLNCSHVQPIWAISASCTAILKIYRVTMEKGNTKHTCLNFRWMYNIFTRVLNVKPNF